MEYGPSPRSGSRGAYRLTRKFASRSRLSRPLSAAVIRAARLNSRSPCIQPTLRLRELATRTNDPYTLVQSTKLLARVGRLHAAKSLFASLPSNTPRALRTSIANIILHNTLSRRDLSDVQQLRATLKTYAALRASPGFQPDHVTVHILVRAHLRKKAGMGADGVRKLFDDLVRSGYPGGAEPWAGSEGPRGSVRIGDFELPLVERPMKLRQDVQPLYKSFITAFYLRGDVAAARRVVGILKVLVAERWAEGHLREHGVVGRDG